MRSSALALLLAAAGLAAAAPAPPVPVVRLDVEIHAVSASFVEKMLKDAGETGAPLVVLAINTPGGGYESMREITQAVLASKVPVVGYVTPSGAQAASAGFVILMSCDVAAMAPGTNTGAASPVLPGGGDLPQTIGKKVREDEAALLRSLVTPRGRPVEAAVKTVTDAVSYSETEALEKKLIEVVARDVPDLMAQLDGRTVKRVGKPDVVLRTKGLRWEWREMTGMQKGLAVIANPALAGLLFLAGLIGLYTEMSHPGAVFPGVLGGICLLLALFAMSVLPTNYAGVALLLLGALFFFLEIKLTAHGLFAIGGAVSIILGAVLLFHQKDMEPNGGFGFLVGGAVATAAILAILSFKALSAQALPQRTGAGALVGQVARIRRGEAGTPKVFLDGALWDVHSEAPLSPGDEVEIVAMDGLSVIVKTKRKET